MAYPAAFHRLVLIGDQFEDTWATSLSFFFNGTPSTAPAVDETLVDAVAAEIETAWEAGTVILPQAQLTSVKLNRIGTDGRYMDADAQEHVYASALPGGAATTGRAAPQLSTVVSWSGPNPRARAGRGRMYLPPGLGSITLDTTGRLTTASATSAGQFAISLIDAAKVAYNAAGLFPVAAICSNVGAGAWQPIASARVGRVVDTVRSRRNRQPEEYVDVTLT